MSKILKNNLKAIHNMFYQIAYIGDAVSKILKNNLKAIHNERNKTDPEIGLCQRY